MKQKNIKLGNKGFSLIELIIVMAIMAILVGILAPQYLKYVEKARRSNDIQTAASIGRAAQIALAEQDLTPAGSYTQDNINAEDDEFAAEVHEVLGNISEPESTGFTTFTITVETSEVVPEVKVTVDGDIELFPTVDEDFKNAK